MMGRGIVSTVGVNGGGVVVEALGIISGNCIFAGGVLERICAGLLLFDEEMVIDRVIVGGFN